MGVEIDGRYRGEVGDADVAELAGLVDYAHVDAALVLDPSASNRGWCF